VNGWATTVNWRRVLHPAFARAVATFQAHAAREKRGGNAGTSVLRALAETPTRSDVVPNRPNGPTGGCLSCTIWALFRPRAVLHRALATSPIAVSSPLACLKARTMYAEDKRFFPDTLPPTLAAIDELWQSYSGDLGDTTFWGPRDRLRCHNATAPSAAPSAAPAVGGARRRAGSGGGGRGGVRSLIVPSGALGCMDSVREVLGPSARLFVAVDAPRLQEIVFRTIGARAFITPGVGVDPTNEYRDEGQKGIKLRQAIGKQDLSERNLIKVSLDYYIQGFCLSSLTLRPSAFYGAAGMRTGAIRAALWTSLRQASPPSLQPPAGGRSAAQCTRGDHMGLEACQSEVCGLTACNLLQ